MTEKVTNIKYKQMDRDPKIIKGFEAIEHMLFGEKSVGLHKTLRAFEITPGAIQKHLDDEFMTEVKQIIDDNKDYIFRESRIRAIRNMQLWIKGKENVGKDEAAEFLGRDIDRCKTEVINELLEKEGVR